MFYVYVSWGMDLANLCQNNVCIKHTFIYRFHLISRRQIKCKDYELWGNWNKTNNNGITFLSSLFDQQGSDSEKEQE